MLNSVHYISASNILMPKFPRPRVTCSTGHKIHQSGLYLTVSNRKFYYNDVGKQRLTFSFFTFQDSLSKAGRSRQTRKDAIKEPGCFCHSAPPAGHKMAATSTSITSTL